MFGYGIFYFALFFFNSCLARHVPRYMDLDEEDKHLFRAAYETPSYDHDTYQEDYDLQPGKLDLVKDGLWAVKAKIKELKAFDKALAANMLSTKLKVKDLMEHHLGPIKKHHHVDVDSKKPSYGYEPTHPHEPQYAPPPPHQYVHEHDPYYGY